MNTNLGKRQLAFGATILTVLVGVTTGCGKPAQPQSAQQATAAGELTLYSAQHAQTTKALVDGFTKETGIKVNVVPGDEATTVAKIEQEGDKSPADVVYTENSPWLAQLDQKGLLSKVDDTALNAVPKADSAASGNWVGVSGESPASPTTRTRCRSLRCPTRFWIWPARSGRTRSRLRRARPTSGRS